MKYVNDDNENDDKSYKQIKCFAVDFYVIINIIVNLFLTFK